MTSPEDTYPVVTYIDDQLGLLPGGQCRCCGAGPNPDEDFWIRKAGICDADGTYYAMLCEYCLDEITAENDPRDLTCRDDLAGFLADLFPSDFDGLQAAMDDEADFHSFGGNE